MSQVMAKLDLRNKSVYFEKQSPLPAHPHPGWVEEQYLEQGPHTVSFLSLYQVHGVSRATLFVCSLAAWGRVTLSRVFG